MAAKNQLHRRPSMRHTPGETPMWLFTPFGFFSIVQKPGDPSLTIRARVREDLDALRERYLPSLSATIAKAGTDYPWRATATHEATGEAMAALVRDLDYGNFKSEVAKLQGQVRATAYHQVWDVLYQLPKSERG
jgi:hypothetical protein